MRVPLAFTDGSQRCGNDEVGAIASPGLNLRQDGS